MSSQSDLTICKIDDELKAKINKFKMRKDKNIAAIVMKIDRGKHLIIEDEELEDISFEEYVDALPTHTPSYSVLSYVYNHDDGRVSYPYCLVFVSPSGCKPELQMMYAGSKTNLVKEVQATKIFEVRSVEEITEEWLKNQLRFFR